MRMDIFGRGELVSRGLKARSKSREGREESGGRAGTIRGQGEEFGEQVCSLRMSRPFR